MNKGQLYIVSAPSGAGKTSLLQQVTQHLPELMVSVSHTTRAPRPGETHGENYYYVSDTEFKQAINNGEFFEHARVFGNYYGTSKKAVQQSLDNKRDVILEIDWQGARKVREQFPQAISIFILPPSMAALEQRLQARAQDSKAIIQARMQEAYEEMIHYSEYNYLIINDTFERAIDELQAIFVSERLRMEAQQAAHQEMLDQLLARSE